jgi:hypothetical protein
MEATVIVALQTLGILLIAVIGLAAVIGAVLFHASFAIYIALFLTVVAMIGIITLCFAKLEVDENVPH